jgi:hypothetical protein
MRQVDDLYELYFFAEKLMLPDLRSRTMDQIQDASRELHLLPNQTTLKKAYEKTPSDSPLRSYCIRGMVYNMLKTTKKSSSGGRIMRQEDMLKIRKTAKQNKDMFEDFLDRFLRDFKTSKDKLVDSRERDEKDKWDRCYFHTHDEDNKCYFDSIPHDADSGSNSDCPCSTANPNTKHLGAKKRRAVTLRTWTTQCDFMQRRMRTAEERSKEPERYTAIKSQL